jgi:hypothetical protein
MEDTIGGGLGQQAKRLTALAPHTLQRIMARLVSLAVRRISVFLSWLVGAAGPSLESRRQRLEKGVAHYSYVHS